MEETFTIIPYKDDLYKLSDLESGWIYYRDKKTNLITGETLKSSFEELQFVFDSVSLDAEFERPRIFHVFYEMGHYYNGEEYLVGREDILAIDLTFSKIKKVRLEIETGGMLINRLYAPEFKDYKKCFGKGYEHLEKGNCYQFNLTFPYRYRLQSSLPMEKIILAYWRERKNRGAYGSATYMANIGKTFLSNSPECLFQIIDQKEGIKLLTMPIKGSIRINEGDDREEKWSELTKCEKNQAELYMISDLMRNDLARIDRPRVDVIRKKAPLEVPGILHQYSLLGVKLNKDIGLGRVLRSLFPGGSVTGAPKKKVMGILDKLEKCPRGFYCGSTIFLYQKCRAASINIRSMSLNKGTGEVSCHAGGGITLASTPSEEYAEMQLKVDSFMQLFRS